MKNPKLKYTGLILAIIGGLTAASGLYFGSMPYYNATIADYSIATYHRNHTSCSWIIIVDIYF